MSSWRVLVVCEGNRVRSPLTAALLARHWPTGWDDTIELASAGTRAQDGLPIPTQGRVLARELGLDPRRHRSRHVAPEQVRDSDLILTMTEQQRDEVQRLVPAATMRTFTLVEFVRLLRAAAGTHATVPEVVRQAHATRPRALRSSLLEDVEDPIGGSDRTYARVGQELVGLVNDLTALLADRDAPPAAPE